MVSIVMFPIVLEEINQWVETVVLSLEVIPVIFLANTFPSRYASG
jgi:hypothetical protein